MRGYRGLLCGLGVASAVVAGSVPALAGSVTKTYYGGFGETQEDAQTSVAGQPSPLVCGANPGITEACFDVSQAHEVDVAIQDATGQPTPTRIWFYDASLARVDGQAPPVNLCGSGHVVIPDGSAFMDVRVGPIGRPGAPITQVPPPVALACGQPEPVTTGTVTVTGNGIGGSDSRARGAAEPGSRSARSARSRSVTVSFGARPERGLFRAL